MLLKTYSCATKRLNYVFKRSPIINSRFFSINVAVVGSGPAGFYTAQKLLKNPHINIDIYERLPVPFGLVRYGVAPDHQEVKNVINSFTTVANNNRVNFYGNVNLGQSIKLDDLNEAYHAVVLCYGSAQDKFMNIEGETTAKNTTSARNFIGLPEDKDPQAGGRSKLRSIIELMRWHKPTGTILALTPALWSVGLMTPETCSSPDLTLIAIFTAGAIAARGMGCTLNDILDRKYDRLVERTRMRPIACGDISTKEALLYLAIQSTIGLYILCLNNLSVIKLGLFSGIMISTYPLFKRFTYWPQIMLALTMNWGVIMGYAAVKGSICINDLTTLMPIYLGSICWTLFYDTIYAHQDKTDDMFIGVKSSALILGSKTKSFLYQMSGGMILSLALSGILTEQLWPYYLSLATAGLFQACQVGLIDLDNKADCWVVFDQQKYIGFLVLGGVLISVGLKSKIFQSNKEKSKSTS